MPDPTSPLTDPADDIRVADGTSGNTPADQPKQGSNLTVVIAFAANLLVAIAKTVVALLTGSAAMLAEAAHSWADTGNEIFLIIGARRARRPEDESHPLGYGRSGYVWAMFAAIGLFAVGAGVSVLHGISSLTEESEGQNYLWGYIVLGISFVLEGTSFAQAFRQTRRGAKKRRITSLRYVTRTSDPMLRAVFAEDSAALVGLIIAALALFLHQITGNAIWDAIGSILVGLLLGVVAIVLIARNASLLTGEGATPRVRQQLLRFLLDHSEIQSVSFLHCEWVGPEELLVIASVDIRGDDRETEVAKRMQDVEDQLESHSPVKRAVLTLTRPGDTTQLTPESHATPRRRPSAWTAGATRP